MAPVSMEFLMSRAPVIPVLAIDAEVDAVALAQALVDGGLPVLEVTLRTPSALAAVTAIAEAVPQAIVGVGTVTRTDQAQAALDAGAQFMVSPGTTAALLRAAEQTQLPLLPGVASASELMVAGEAGYRHLKFFPAQSAGGVEALRAWQGPFAEVRFCPTGGINASNYLAYLELANVLCVGGSWVAPADAMASADWARIRGLAAGVSGTRLRPSQSVDSLGDDGDRWYSVAGEEDPGSADEDLHH